MNNKVRSFLTKIGLSKAVILNPESPIPTVQYGILQQPVLGNKTAGELKAELTDPWGMREDVVGMINGVPLSDDYVLKPYDRMYFARRRDPHIVFDD